MELLLGVLLCGSVMILVCSAGRSSVEAEGTAGYVIHNIYTQFSDDPLNVIISVLKETGQSASGLGVRHSMELFTGQRAICVFWDE